MRYRSTRFVFLPLGIAALLAAAPAQAQSWRPEKNVESGKLRMLAVAAPRRLSGALASAPTDLGLAKQ